MATNETTTATTTDADGQYVNMEQEQGQQEPDVTDFYVNKLFGFADEGSEDLVTPTSTSTVALPLVFVVCGLCASNGNMSGSWALILLRVISLAFALCSDCLPLQGLRRKPYMTYAFYALVAFNLLTAFVPALALLSEACRLCLTIVADAMVVERTRLQQGERVTLLVTCQAMYYLGSGVRGAASLLLGGWLEALLMTVVVPLAMCLVVLPKLQDATLSTEVQVADSTLTDRVKDVGGVVFVTLQTKMALVVTAFTLLYVTVNTCVYVMNIFDGQMDWFLADQWAFGLAGCILILLYPSIMNIAKSSWHRIFVACSLLLLLLIGVGYFFYSGMRVANIVMAGIMALSTIPLLIMYTSLCPHGAEATMYFLLNQVVRAVAKEMGVQLFFMNTFNRFYWVAYLLVLVPFIVLRFVPKNRTSLLEQVDGMCDMVSSMYLVGLIGLVGVFLVGTSLFWTFGYEQPEGNDDSVSYYSSDYFWQDFQRFQNVY